jgi:23S rRNA (adenine2030-N6)-methyltransferase
MFAYRHHFHAGNFADVFKHALLSQLILSLQKKDRPIVYVDTHAGIGHYDLAHPWAAKNKEYILGAGRIFGCVDYPPDIGPYIDILSQNNEGESLSKYPGSPVIARHLLRKQDRLVLNEFNSSDAEQLRRLTKNWSRTEIRREDGFRLTKSVLPPKERRGLIFIDPSYDRKGEFERIASTVEMGLKRFATGVYAIWYPVMSESVTQDLIQRVKTSYGDKSLLRSEIYLSQALFPGLMSACGLLIVNPPYQFESVANTIGRWLLDKFDSSDEGRLLNQIID